MNAIKIILIWLSSICITSFLFSCKPSGNNTSAHIPVKFTKSEIEASTVLEKHTFVKLQSYDQNAIIGYINRVLCADSMVFILDYDNNKVVSFDYEGNYLNSTLDLIGHAQNEYVQLTDAAIDEENKEIYLYCDRPYQMLILDYNLQVKECIPMKDLLLEIAVDSEYLYALYPDLTDGSKYELRYYRKDDLSGSPQILLRQDKAIPEATGMGCCLSKNGNFIYVCLPFDNIIYKIADGKVIQDYKIDLGDRWFDYSKSKGLKGRRFFEANKGKDWTIQNIAASEKEILFNTNLTEVFDVTIDKDECVAYSSLLIKSMPSSQSWIISTSGKYDLSFSIPAAALVDYNDFYTRRNEPLPDNVLNPIIQSAKLGDNPLIVLGKLK